MNMTAEQNKVAVAFGDAIKAERTQFLQEALEALDTMNTIKGAVARAFESVNDIEGEEAEALKAHLTEQMVEYTRRGLQRAVKGIAKYADELE